MSSSRGAEAPPPRPIGVGGAVGRGTAVGLSSQRRSTMTKTSKNAPTAASSTRKSDNASPGTKPFAASGTTARAVAPKAPTKRQQLAALVVRDDGATLNQMIAATGWL